MNLPFTLLLSSFLFIIFLRALIITLHELGHAIPAILFTKQKATIYIGSYGNPEKSFNFKIGLLEIWFSYEKLSWRNGVCIPTGNMSIKQQLIFTICGPLCSFIVALALYCFVPESDHSYQYLLYIQFFLGFSALDLITNLVPNSKPIVLSNGKVTYNDGYHIKRLLMHKQINSKFEEAVNLFNANDILNAIPLFDYLLNKTASDTIYRLSIRCYIRIKNYEKARILCDEFITKFEVDSNDYVMAGLVYSYLGYVKKALEYYEKALELDRNNVHALNNKGYSLNILDRYQEAIPCFDSVIEINESAFAYTNRGLSKIKTGQTDAGLLDIEKSMKLKENNSYNYRNLGIYHFDLGEFDKALEFFLKAKELDPDTYIIDELIIKTQSV